MRLVLSLCLLLAACTDAPRGTGSTGPVTGTSHGPKVSPDATCDDYLACVLQTTPMAYSAALTAYGADSVCWQSAGATAGCAQACSQATAQLQRGFKTDCCQTSADCHGGTCDTKTGVCGCATDAQCEVGVCLKDSSSKMRCERSVDAVLSCAMGHQATDSSASVPACLGKAGCCNVSACAQLGALNACVKNCLAQPAPFFGGELTPLDCAYNECQQQYDDAQHLGGEDCT